MKTQKKQVTPSKSKINPSKKNEFNKYDDLKAGGGRQNHNPDQDRR